jgi:hypothetical protein
MYLFCVRLFCVRLLSYCWAGATPFGPAYVMAIGRSFGFRNFVGDVPRKCTFYASGFCRRVGRAQPRLAPPRLLPSAVPFSTFFRDVPRKCTFFMSGFCRRDGRAQPRLVPLRSLPSAVPFWSFFRDIPRKCILYVYGFGRRDERAQPRLVPPRFFPSTVPFWTFFSRRSEEMYLLCVRLWSSRWAGAIAIGAAYVFAVDRTLNKIVEKFSKSPIVWLDARHILHCRESSSKKSGKK